MWCWRFAITQPSTNQQRLASWLWRRDILGHRGRVSSIRRVGLKLQRETGQICFCHSRSLPGKPASSQGGRAVLLERSDRQTNKLWGGRDAEEQSRKQKVGRDHEQRKRTKNKNTGTPRTRARPRTGALAGWLLCCCPRPPALNPVHAGQRPQQHVDVDCRTGVGWWRGVECRAPGYP